MLTKGKGQDEEEQESKKEEEHVRKKGKITITKTPKTSIAVFTRRSKKKGVSEVVIVKPPPTFQERLNKLRVGVGINNFKD